MAENKWLIAVLFHPEILELWDPTYQYNEFSGAHRPVYLDETTKNRLPGHALPPSPYQDANGGPAWRAAIEFFLGSLSSGTKWVFPKIGPA